MRQPLVSLRSVRLCAVILLVTTIAAGAGSVTAQGTGPSSALAPGQGWTTIAVGQRLWYSFEYAGDRSQITVRMGASPRNSVVFSVWTAANVDSWARSGKENPVGRGTPNASLGNDLAWSGNFNTRGTYYVSVEQKGATPGSFDLQVSGNGVTSAAGPGDAAARIANAMSAAPMAIAKDATIYDWPDGGDFVLLRQGTNGWTCYADWPGSPLNDPECNDPLFEAWFRALMSGAPQPPAITSVGVAYMLAGGSDPSNTDPFAAAPAPGEDWINGPPHVMLIAPQGFDSQVFSTDPTAPIFIMWAGTPYQHLMVSTQAAPWP